uniref:Endonuclease/exonuclease/phosphatase domain-containing protein n=1 Tax=viral metagenome TaxID=1070528 RepID=A0A6C0DPK3_9ZZZZ
MSLYFYIFLFFSTIGSLYADTECPNVIATNSTSKINQLRIVQYNVEWLFMDYCASSDCPGAGCTWKNKTSANAHIKTTSNIISNLSPTIINLCEVEGCDELNELVKNIETTVSPSVSLLTPYLRKGKDTSTGQNVALLTRITPSVSLYRTEERYNYPIEGSKCNYKGEPTSAGVSKHYITEIFTNNINIALIGAHFVAFPTDPSRCAEREAQAMVIQKVVFQYISKGFEVILLGDLNDYDGDVLDANNNIPTSHVLRILKGQYGDYSGKYSLYNVAEEIPQKERYSAWWDKNSDCKSTPTEFSMIDHMLVTSKMRGYIKTAYYFHGYVEKCDIYESDHYPLVVDFIV